MWKHMIYARISRGIVPKGRSASNYAGCKQLIHHPFKECSMQSQFINPIPILSIPLNSSTSLQQPLPWGEHSVLCLHPLYWCLGRGSPLVAFLTHQPVHSWAQLSSKQFDDFTLGCSYHHIPRGFQRVGKIETVYLGTTIVSQNATSCLKDWPWKPNTIWITQVYP